ncbi:MAG: threonine--tRNA ligase [Candidatus Micrarchaeota archaeon]|nr:threonine--tRNA ligase [Candidatus Micrarchaeota archaeon]MCX8154593.1 threonine--tRNA ligase [Candidatus Micrarchaeota archaeon]
MRLLLLHSSSITVTPRERAIEISDEPIPVELQEVLVVFMSVERGDLDDYIESAKRDILEQAQRLKVKNILVYPYVHLTNDPESPVRAKELTDRLYDSLKQQGYDVYRAPFGWYKEFRIHVYGHPLSELSKTYRKDTEYISKSLRQESNIKSRFMILWGDRLYDVSEFNYSEFQNLKKLVDYETRKIRAYESEPVHIELMSRLKIASTEPASDAGNIRYYPRGRMIKKILERMVSEYCIADGAHEVETPIMYDYNHPSLEKYLNRFPARQYTVLSDQKRYFLRFAACFGQFLIAHDTHISYRQLPMKMYELTRYSFRREQSGEVSGLKRLRAFTMPDMHTIVADMEMAKQEFIHQLRLSKRLMEELGLFQHIEIAFRAQEEFFDTNREFYREVQKVLDNRPILLELFDQRYAYFVTKFEFNFIDSKDKAAALSTVQIDVENAETYDIKYIDRNGELRRPIILHASISGAIERVMFAILEREGMKIRAGGRGEFPLFLAPIQARIIPVSREYLDYANQILLQMKNYLRTDLDDRDETLSKKIREAQMEWIPYIVVVGKDEMETGKISVTSRDGRRTHMTLDEFLRSIRDRIKYFEPLNMPSLLSRRGDI